MTERIAVGVTDSSGSQRAVDWAIERASTRHGRLVLVSVVGEARGVIGEKSVLQHAAQVTTERLEAQADLVRMRDVAVTTSLERGDPVGRLVEMSAAVDVLVIGSNVEGPRSSRLRGPHGVRIAAAAHCPVVIVPDLSTTGRSGVVVGVDGSVSCEKAIAFAAAEADRFGDTLTAVLTWSPVPLPFEMSSYPEDYLGQMQNVAEETLSISLAGLSQTYPSLAVRRVVQSGLPAATIARESEKARLAVVGSHGRGAVARFLLGSTSQALIHRLPTVTAVIR